MRCRARACTSRGARSMPSRESPPSRSTASRRAAGGCAAGASRTSSSAASRRWRATPRPASSPAVAIRAAAGQARQSDPRGEIRRERIEGGHMNEDHPVRFSAEYPERPLNRLTTALRIFTIIPIAIVLASIGGYSGQGNYDAGGDAPTIVIGGIGLLFLPPLL